MHANPSLTSSHYQVYDVMTDSSFDEIVLIPGPSFHVELAALDALHPIHYSRRLFIFRCESSAQRATQLEALKSGLQVLVKHCPILGGIVTPLLPDEAIDGKPDWRTIVPGPGLELIVKDLQSSMASFEELEKDGFPFSKLPYKLLVPVPADISNDRPFAACKVQFSAIKGGSILTFAMSHSVTDGSGTNELTRVLSEETRFAQEGLPSKASSEVGGLDRSVMRNITSNTPFKIEDHPAYRWKANIGQPENASSHPFEATTPEVPVLLRISAASLAKLKADATQPDAPPISTHDALAALLWRSVLLIRSRRSSESLSASTMGSIFMPSDACRHLNFPPSYMGNAVYQLTAELDLGTLLSSPSDASGLQHAASAIRRAISTLTPELVSSCMAMTNERWLDWAFLETASTTGVAMGTDWTSGELYGHDWGKAFGPLVRYRYPDEAGNCIFPRLPDGAAEVLVGVTPQEVGMLWNDECFGQYIEGR